MFKVGRRVRYMAKLSASRLSKKGQEATVEGVADERSRLVIRFDDGTMLVSCRIGNLELARAKTALERRIEKYIDAEKKELGLA